MFTTDNLPNSPFHYISSSTQRGYIPFGEIDKTLEDIRASKTALSSTLFILEQDAHIRPIECDETISVINDIKKMAAKATNSLKSRIISRTSNVAYYKLLMHLYKVNDKSSKLNDLMKQFRSICTETTTDQRKILNNVKKEISSIVWICEKIENETESILDAMLLQDI